MNFYKKIIPSKNLRFKILNMLSFVPDKMMLRIQYFIKLKRWLNLKNPKRYTEKIQWYKLYYRNPLMVKCVDKYEVREYVKEKGLGHILNTLYGVYDSFDEIDFDALPDKFIIKANNGSGTNYICKDKSKLDIAKLRKEFADFFMQTKKSAGREWVYDNVKPKIIVEKLLEIDESGDLPDYKFFCFNGKVFCSYMMENYTMNHDDGIMGFLDKDFNLLKAHRVDFAQMKSQPEKPLNYEKMVEYAEILSEPFPHVRVDFYNIGGEIVFGELTFFNASGYTMFEPDSFDFELGAPFILPLIK